MGTENRLKLPSKSGEEMIGIDKNNNTSKI